MRFNPHQVVIKEQVRRTFHKGLLPMGFLTSPRFWNQSRLQTVLVRYLTDDGLVLIAPF